MNRYEIMETLFPWKVALTENSKIMSDYKKKSWVSTEAAWSKKFNAYDGERLHRIVNDVYDSEFSRKDTIESKATSLFEGFGVIAAVLSIVLVFGQNPVLLVLLLLPIGSLLLGAICAWRATVVGEYNYFTTLSTLDADLSKTCTMNENENARYWAIQKIICVEKNSSLLLMKSNWLSAAYYQLLWGLALIIPPLVILLMMVM